MKFERVASAALVVSLTAAACTGSSDPQAAPDTTAPPTSAAVIAETTTTVATTVAPTASSEAPASLAFASSRDVGRLFEPAIGAQAFDAPGDDGELVALDASVVRATRVRSVSGSLWVQINQVESNDRIGWIEADKLDVTTQSIYSDDASTIGQFRQVPAAVKGDSLALSSVPDGAPTGVSLAEDQVAMHGGGSAVAPSGSTWVDVIDPVSRTRLGWVPASDFRVLSGGQIKDDAGLDISRRAKRDVTYGAPLPTGALTVTGCNAAQVVFQNNAAIGLAIVFGKAAPTGTPRRAGDTVFRWGAPGGTTVYVDPGSSATFTLLTAEQTTWHFAALDDEGQVEFERGVDGAPALTESGRAIARNPQELTVSAGTCSPELPDPNRPTLDEYVYDLDPEARDAAIAQYERDLAEYEGRPLPTTTTIAPAGDAADEATGETTTTTTVADDGSSDG